VAPDGAATIDPVPIGPAARTGVTEGADGVESRFVAPACWNATPSLTWKLALEPQAATLLPDEIVQVVAGVELTARALYGGAVMSMTGLGEQTAKLEPFLH